MGKVLGSKRKSVFIIILWVFIVLTVGFIWGNSLQSTTNSAQTSSGVYTFFKPLLDFVFGKNNFTHTHFRKLAHFAEFFVLGIEIYLLFRVKYGNIRCKIITIVLIGFFAGLIDESLQVLSSRGASMLDVLIDFSGFCSAVILSILATITIYKIKGKNHI